MREVSGAPGTAAGGGAPRARRVLRGAAVALAGLVLATAGAGYLYVEHLNGNLRKEDLHLGDNKLDSSKPDARGRRPLNILLLGSDSRNSDENVRLGGARADRGRPPLADVQMLLHLSADRDDLSVLSIPRDTRVTIPRCTDPDDGTVHGERVDRINASLQNGGPGCTVATWEELTGIPVDHFMMVDFAGVVAMADAVGGVPVCVDANVHDRRSGLRLREGETTVRGEQALQWLRTRHGFADGSDLGRAKAQHMYMSSMVRQLKEGTRLSDPGKLRALAEEATGALTVDRGLDSVGKLYDLAQDLRQVPTERITLATMPWVYAPGGAHVLPKEGEAEQVFSMIRRDVALDGRGREETAGPEAGADGGSDGAGDSADDGAPAPGADRADVAVRVLNGTGTAARPAVTGRAGAVAEALRADGFTRAAAEHTPRSQWDTVLTYPRAGQRGEALAVARSLGLPDRAVRHSAGEPGLTLTVGADWREGTAYPAPPGGAPEPSADEPPDSLDGLSGDDASACMEVNPNATW
ncbi:LCP family protein [Streptomyces sp. TRM 70351]|uniref:LCP family protein n=1 Tax=Streptomyces sp. TRM 70351 TaxID=3116552 RepID=UPI002E7C056A|nr:LCP family protein [Streptomyces sp. TRM 70351]MEE1929328.1 LCP family protein [Streptomyces sp. TRM 70351]